MKTFLVVTGLFLWMPLAALAQPTCTPTWSGDFWNLEQRGETRVIKTLDDGSGACVYIGEQAVQNDGDSWITRFDGEHVELLGPFRGEVGAHGGGVFALDVFDDGGGLALFAGGGFTSVDGMPAAGVAKRRGGVWEPLGSGVNEVVRDFCAFDDGSGPKLYIGGLFTQAGGIAASCVASWDGSQWAPAGTGLSGGITQPQNQAPSCYTLTLADLGKGPVLVAGGVFDHAGGVPAWNVAQWNGSAWSPVGAGLTSG
jgi:hypothetical protein